MSIKINRSRVQIFVIVLLIPLVSNGQSINYNLSEFDNVVYSSNYLPEASNTENKKPQYFNNYLYVEVWGHSWYSINYFRFIQSQNVLIGGGIGATPEARTFTLAGDAGGIMQLFIDKQFKISKKFQYGFGVGATYDFSGAYSNFFDPFYLKASINRYSISLAKDKLYYGVSLYYQKWGKWAIRPGVRLGISF